MDLEGGWGIILFQKILKNIGFPLCLGIFLLNVGVPKFWGRPNRIYVFLQNRFKEDCQIHNNTYSRDIKKTCVLEWIAARYSFWWKLETLFSFGYSLLAVPILTGIHLHCSSMADLVHQHALSTTETKVNKTLNTKNPRSLIYKYVKWENRNTSDSEPPPNTQTENLCFYIARAGYKDPWNHTWE